MIASEELRGGERGDQCRMKLAVFQKTFEFGLTDASMLLKYSARDLKMRARAVLRDSLRAARRLAGTGLDDLNNKEIFLSSFRLFRLAAMASVDSLWWE